MEQDVENVKKILKENGYKYTSQRKDIYEIFLNDKEKHLSTEDVYERVKKVNSEIGIATVYRTMLLFEELGIVYRNSFDDGVARYEIKPNNIGHRHHHLVCVSCGSVTEVKMDLLDNLEEEIEKDEKFKILDHNLKFYGYCKNCYKEDKGETDEKH